MKKRTVIIVVIVVGVLLVIGLITLFLLGGNDKRFEDYKGEDSVLVKMEGNPSLEDTLVVGGSVYDGDYKYKTSALLYDKYKTHYRNDYKESMFGLPSYVTECIELLCSGTRTNVTEISDAIDCSDALDLPHTIYCISLDDGTMWYVYDYYENEEATALFSSEP